MHSSSEARSVAAPRMRSWLALGLLIAVILGAGCLAFVAHVGRELEKARLAHQIRFGQEDLDRQLGELRLGHQKGIYLYDTIETDALLGRIEGLAAVEELGLELTDATDDGLAAVATLSNL